METGRGKGYRCPEKRVSPFLTIFSRFLHNLPNQLHCPEEDMYKDQLLNVSFHDEIHVGEGCYY